MDQNQGLHLDVVASTLQDFSAVEIQRENSGYQAVHVRGQHMATTAELFTEFAAAFQFPWYFGQNWAAFDECMRDLDEWLPPGTHGYALAVWNADAVLVKDKSALEAFVDSLNFIHQELAEPSGLVSTGTGVASPTPRGFQVVLHCEPGAHDRLLSRWTHAGARLNPPAAAHL
ncbi:barstar family protein [Nocardia brasiliensis]|uniref:barstar family protein n=1 Tax=Nocardia brasiliensis TaxID=37326 RepID=UPI0024554965|nr:barstar family protein [Nocardia brasiliensis]